MGLTKNFKQWIHFENRFSSSFLLLSPFKRFFLFVANNFFRDVRHIPFHLNTSQSISLRKCEWSCLCYSIKISKSARCNGFYITINLICKSILSEKKKGEKWCFLIYFWDNLLASKISILLMLNWYYLIDIGSKQISGPSNSFIFINDAKANLTFFFIRFNKLKRLYYFDWDGRQNQMRIRYYVRFSGTILTDMIGIICWMLSNARDKKSKVWSIW